MLCHPLSNRSATTSQYALTNIRLLNAFPQLQHLNGLTFFVSKFWIYSVSCVETFVWYLLKINDAYWNSPWCFGLAVNCAGMTTHVTLKYVTSSWTVHSCTIHICTVQVLGLLKWVLLGSDARPLGRAGSLTLGPWKVKQRSYFDIYFGKGMSWPGNVACMGKKRNLCRLWLRSLKKSNKLEHREIDGRMILKWMINRKGGYELD